MSSDLAQRRVYLQALCRTVPYTVVEAVLADPTELSVRSSQIAGTVMHADIVGFTALCERLATRGSGGLGVLTRALNRLFTRLLEDAIFPYEGYVIQFAGDAVTALFRDADHALRAATSALTAQKLLLEDDLELAELRETGGGRPLLLRIGVASGEIALPIVGDLSQRAVLVGGPTAHRAVHLQERARPGFVVIDEDARALLEGHAEMTAVGDGAFELLAVRSPPPKRPIVELADRVVDRIEEKIALLEPFVAPPLALRLKTTPSGWRIAGELRDVVVVFTEIVVAPDLVTPTVSLDMSRSLLRAFRKYGGLATKADLSQGGQRIMVLFGLHLPSPNDVERALLAALEATARLKGYLASTGSALVLRTGVHAGPVYFGAFGSEYRHDITVVGDTVNTAARVCSAAAPFEVLATAETFADVKTEFIASSRAPLRVKGKTEPLAVTAVHSPAVGVAHYLQTRGRQRLLAGRAPETARLHDVVDRAWEGEGALVGIGGGDGTGKSALLSFVVDEWTRLGGLGLLGRCRYATRSEPLAPIVAMFRAFLGLTREGDDAERRARIRAGLEPFDLSRGAPELVALLLPVQRPDGAQEALVDLEDVHARERVISSLVEFLERRVQQEKVLYVVEDLHYADSLTLELVTRLSQMPRSSAFLFLATYRPDPLLGPVRATFDHDIVLANLDAEQSEALLVHELGARSVEPALLAFLHQRTRGNPAHLVDVVRFLRDRELLHVRAGMVVAPDGGLGLLEDVVPQTAASAALAQLDGLGEVEKRLVRMAAVIGPSFSRELLDDIARGELDEELVGWAMERLEASSVITPESGEHGYTFRDDVTRATAYQTTPEEQRREIHRRIADAIESRKDGDPARDAAVIAVHRERACQWDKAAIAYERAARFASKTLLHSEALHFVERWEAAVARIADGGRERPDAGTATRMALLKLGALGRRRLPARALAQARTLLAPPMVDALTPESKTIVEFWLGSALGWTGHPKEAREQLARVWESSTEQALQRDTAIEIAQTYACAGARAEASMWLDRAADLTFVDPVRSGTIELLRASVRTRPEELAASRAACAKVHEQARTHRFHHLAAAAAFHTARLDLAARRFADARAGFGEALRIERALGHWAELARALTGLGETFVWEGRPSEAREHLEDALRFAREADDRVAIAEATVHLGGAIGLSSDPAEGATLVTQGEQLAEGLGLADLLAAAALHRLAITLLAGDGRAARELVSRAKTHVADWSMPLLRFAADVLFERVR